MSELKSLCQRMKNWQTVQHAWETRQDEYGKKLWNDGEGHYCLWGMAHEALHPGDWISIVVVSQVVLGIEVREIMLVPALGGVPLTTISEIHWSLRKSLGGHLQSKWIGERLSKSDAQGTMAWDTSVRQVDNILAKMRKRRDFGLSGIPAKDVDLKWVL